MVSNFFMIPMFAGDDFVKNFGVVLLLFETPSGFAIFGFHGTYLYKSDAIEVLQSSNLPSLANVLASFLVYVDLSLCFILVTRVYGQTSFIMEGQLR